MANTCGELRFLEGGTITDSTVLNSTITSSVVSNSTVDTATITDIRSIDSSSADTIANAIADNAAAVGAIALALIQSDNFIPAVSDALAALTPSDLQALADAIQAILANRASAASTGVTPVCTGGILPGVILSNVAQPRILGEPDAFAAFGNGFVPVYDSPCQDV